MVATPVTQKTLTLAHNDGILVVYLTPPFRRLTDEEFWEFCVANRDLRVEQTADGDLIIMPSTNSATGGQNFELIGVFWSWVRADGTGKGFDSSAVFTLPNGAKRGPDLSWVRLERWEALTPADQWRFAPLCPDFVVELRSPSDALETVKAKMEEYRENGAQLGWLIDPIERKVHVYRPGQPVECLDDPVEVSGEPLLRGFVLKLADVWD